MDKLPDIPDGFEPAIAFDDESLPIHVRRNEALRMMQVAEKAAKARGITWSRKEAEYYTAKADETFELYREGTPATVIAQIIKGMPRTNKALELRIAEKVGYENANEAVQCYKLIARMLEADIEREWSEARSGL